LPCDKSRYAPELASTAAISLRTLAYRFGRTVYAYVAMQPSQEMAVNRGVAAKALASKGMLNVACWKINDIGEPLRWLMALTKLA
jgi:hypothetical protein